MCQGCMIESATGQFRRPTANGFSGETELKELLRDPIARALMAADRVDSSEVYALLRKARDRGFSDSVR